MNPVNTEAEYKSVMKNYIYPEIEERQKQKEVEKNETKS